MQQPTLAGFTDYLTTAVGIDASILPPGSNWALWSYDRSLNTVNDMLLGAVSQDDGSYTPYTLAVYSLATHFLIEIGQDVSYPITAASWAQGLVTLTTSGASAIAPGNMVAVSGISPVAYDAAPSAPVRVNSVDTGLQQITYPVQNNPGAGSVLAGAKVWQTYFYRARESFGINRFAPGLVASAGDQGTSAALDMPEWVKGLTLQNLQMAKTPWGRQAMGIMQSVGTLWGLT